MSLDNRIQSTVPHLSHPPSLFVSCSPMLEPLLKDELQELGISALREGYRGVFVDEWDWTTLYKVNYASRLASRVLLPLAQFRCFDQRSLYRQAMSIDWSPFFRHRESFAIDANVHHRSLRNSLFAAQVVKDAICDQMRREKGWRPSVQLQNPDVQINLFIHDETGSISLDTSGEPLHKRGYRQETVEAPVRETLAAAVLRLAAYSVEDTLLDPCCGSGTFLIEAALIASRTPPGYLRRQWGFMRHPAFVQAEWLGIRARLDESRRALPNGRLFGMDKSQGAVRACKINLKAAGFQQEVEVQQADFRECMPSVAPTCIIANPPHGRRLEDEGLLAPLYRALGDFMKRTCANPGRGYVLTTSASLSKEVGLATKRRHVLDHGGLEARLLEYVIF